MKFLNLRGPNGSGKTTLLRNLALSPEARTVPVWQPVGQPPKSDRPLMGPALIKWERELNNIGKPKGKPIVATVLPNGVALLGDYTRAASGSTTAGCDRISRQDDVKAALLGAAALPGVDLVVFEGIIVSTIFLPWLEWEKANGGMWWAFLDTPLEVCLARIQQRNGGVAVKEDQIAGKHKTIAEVRRKVLGAYPAGGRVITIRWQTALKDMKETVAACLDHIRNGEGPGEEDGPWATGWEERAGGDFPGEFDRPRGAVSMTLDAGHYQEPAAPPAPAPHIPCCPDEERNASGMCVYCGDPGR